MIHIELTFELKLIQLKQLYKNSTFLITIKKKKNSLLEFENSTFS